MAITRLKLVLLLSASTFLSLSLLSCSAARGGNTPASAAPPGNGGGSGSGGGTGSGGASNGTQFVYTADAQSFDISGFQIGNDGGITALAGSPFPVLSRPPYISSPLALGHAGKYLLAESMSPDSEGGIETFTINSTNGTLTPVTMSPPPASPDSFIADGGSLAVDQGRNVVYASGTHTVPIPNGNSGGPALGAFAVNGDGSLTPLRGSPYNIPAGTVALDPLGRFLYVVNSGQLWVIPRNSDGSLAAPAPGSPFKLQGVQAATPEEACSFSNQASVATSASGAFLYVACGGSTSLNVLSVDSSGRVAPVQSLAPATTSQELSSVTLNPAGNLLLATEEAANAVLVFSVDPASGKLTQVASASAGTRPNSAAFDKSGAFVYVTNGSSVIAKDYFLPGSNNISAYAVAQTGSLSPVRGSPFSTGGSPRSVTVVQP